MDRKTLNDDDGFIVTPDQIARIWRDHELARAFISLQYNLGCRDRIADQIADISPLEDL